MLTLELLYENTLVCLIFRLCEFFLNLFYYNSESVTPADKDPDLDADPLRASYVRSIPKAQLFRNVLLQGYIVSTSVLKNIDDVEIRSDDTFLISYPKSGTTWTLEILSLIINHGDVSKVSNKIQGFRSPSLEFGSPIGQLRFLRNLKSPRLLSTHLTLPLIPKQLRHAKCKIIYVVRNPKDQAVSFFHFHRIGKFLGNYKGTWDEFFSLFVKGHLVHGSWFDHVLPYWKFSQEHPDKVLFISYEELKMDLPGMIVRISQFVGRPLRPDAINTISQHCSFEQMKDNNMVNMEHLPLSIYDMTDSKFIRKGIIGDWKNYFTPAQNEEFEILYTRRMQDSGLDLVFEPEEALQRMRVHGRLILDNTVVDKNTSGNVGGLSKQDSGVSLDSKESVFPFEDDAEKESEPLMSRKATSTGLTGEQPSLLRQRSSLTFSKTQ